MRLYTKALLVWSFAFALTVAAAAQEDCLASAVPAESSGDITEMRLIRYADNWELQFDTPDHPSAIDVAISVDGQPQTGRVEPGLDDLLLGFTSAGEPYGPSPALVDLLADAQTLQVAVTFSTGSGTRPSTARFDLSSITDDLQKVRDQCPANRPFPAHFEIGGADRIVLRPPSQAEATVVRDVFGDGIFDGGAGGPPRLQVATPDLDSDGVDDLVVVQKGQCSNVTCDYHFLLSAGVEWLEAGTIEMWGTPYIAREPTSSTMVDIIALVRLDDECTACRKPTPVRYIAQAGGGYSQGQELDANTYPFYRSNCEPYETHARGGETFDTLMIDWQLFGPRLSLRAFPGQNPGRIAGMVFDDGGELPHEMEFRPLESLQFTETDSSRWYEVTSTAPDLWPLADILEQFAKNGSVRVVDQSGARTWFPLDGSADAISKMRTCIEVIN